MNNQETINRINKKLKRLEDEFGYEIIFVERNSNFSLGIAYTKKFFVNEDESLSGNERRIDAKIEERIQYRDSKKLFKDLKNAFEKQN